MGGLRCTMRRKAVMPILHGSSSRMAPTTVQDNDGSTSLHKVALSGHVDLARFLIEHGADVTAQEKDGWTSLHRAAFRGHVDLAGYLVENGAQVTAQDEDGMTPLHLALMDGHLDLAWLLAGAVPT